MSYSKLKTAIAAITLLVSCFSFSACNKKQYERADDTAFVVLMISDIHLDNTANYTKRAFRTIDDLVALSKPDFIIVTGDLTGVDTRNDLAFISFGEKMESYNIPWTFTFGNHDSQADTWGRTEIAEYLESLNNCRFEKGDDSVYGCGNQYFNVTDENGKVIHTIFTLDTSREKGGTHKIESSQIDWYTRSVKEIASDVNGDESKVVPSTIFAHIPMREFEGAYATAKEQNKVVYGKRGEKECPNGEEDELFETMVALGSTKAYFCGHEHLNNYVVYLDGIRLTYGETCDHKMYIPTRGGLIVNFKKDGTVTQQNVSRSRFSSNYKITEEF